MPIKKLFKKSNVIIFIIIISFLIFSYLYFDNLRKVTNEKNKEFYHTKVVGIVSLPDFKYKVDHIVMNNNYEYFFYNWIGIDTSAYPILVISPGDSIYKPALSDTLLIIKKNGKQYRFYHMDNK